MMCVRVMKSCLCVLCTLTVACQNPATPAPMASSAEQPESRLTLRTYEVAPGQSDRMRSVLTRVLHEQGSIETLPGESLLVAAPEHIQKDIKDFIENGPKLEASPSKVIVFDYWLVLGTLEPRLAEESQMPSRQLDALSKELDVIREAEGYAHFTLLDHVQLATLDGERGVAQSGVISEVEQTVSMHGDVCEARLRLKGQPVADQNTREFSTTLRFESGQSIVLGQAGYEVQGVRGSIFYVVRAVTQQ